MLPRVIMHNMVSVDGRTLGFDADIGLYYELASRWEVDAHLTGADTLLAAGDGASEADEGTAPPAEPDPADGRPLLVVTDSRGRLGNLQALRHMPFWRGVVVLCSRRTPQEHLQRLRSAGIDTIVAGEERADLRAALEELNARYGVETVLLDSGGTLSGAMLQAGLVHEVSILISPWLVGGANTGSIFRSADAASPAIPLKLAQVEQVRGDAVWLRYEVAR